MALYFLCFSPFYVHYLWKQSEKLLATIGLVCLALAASALSFEILQPFFAQSFFLAALCYLMRCMYEGWQLYRYSALLLMLAVFGLLATVVSVPPIAILSTAVWGGYMPLLVVPCLRDVDRKMHGFGVWLIWLGLYAFSTAHFFKTPYYFIVNLTLLAVLAYKQRRGALHVLDLCAACGCVGLLCGHPASFFFFLMFWCFLCLQKSSAKGGKVVYAIVLTALLVDLLLVARAGLSLNAMLSFCAIPAFGGILVFASKSDAGLPKLNVLGNIAFVSAALVMLYKRYVSCF